MKKMVPYEIGLMDFKQIFVIDRAFIFMCLLAYDFSNT